MGVGYFVCGRHILQCSVCFFYLFFWFSSEERHSAEWRVNGQKHTIFPLIVGKHTIYCFAIMPTLVDW